MTTNYSAAIDTSDVQLAFAEETTWGTAPTQAYAATITGTYQMLRLTGESIAESKQRTRPQEINPTGVVSNAVTTQVSTEGGVNFALSAPTVTSNVILKSYEQFLCAVIGANDFAPEVSVSATSCTTTTIVGTGMATIPANTWIMVSGCVAQPGNNGWWKTTNANSTATTITLAANQALVAETVAITVRYTPQLTNGTNFRSFTFEKKLASNLYLTAKGAQVTQFQLNASVGGFAEGSFNVMAKEITTGTSITPTNGYTAAPVGRVINTVSGVAKVWMDGNVLSAPAQSFQLNLQRQNARAQYAIGSSGAQGMGKGTLDVNGTLSLYFKDFTMYNYYRNETAVNIELALMDANYGGYVLTIPAATLMNPSIVAGGPDTDVMAEFQLEGNPSAGVIFKLDRVKSLAT